MTSIRSFSRGKSKYNAVILETIDIDASFRAKQVLRRARIPFAVEIFPLSTSNSPHRTVQIRVRKKDRLQAVRLLAKEKACGMGKSIADSIESYNVNRTDR